MSARADSGLGRGTGVVVQDKSHLPLRRRQALQIDPSINPSSHLLDPILYTLVPFELCSAHLFSGGDSCQDGLNQALELRQGNGPAHLAAG